jgi:O-antigen/teichoic acid export membrane protein
LALVAFNQVLASFSLMFRAVLQGRHRFVADSILSVLDRFVALILCSGFLYFYENQFIAEQGITLFLIAQASGYFLAVILGIILVKRTDNAEPPTDYTATLSLENETLKNWIQKVGWFVVMAFAMSVFTRVDALMIRQYSVNGLTTYLKPISEGYYQAGIYAQSYRLLDAALIFSTLLSTQLLPMFTRKIANNENVKGILKIATLLVFSIGITASLVAIFGGNFILNFIYKSGYSNPAELAYATQIFGILMTSFLPMALIHVFGTFVTALGQMKWLAFMAIGCMVLNIVINFVLIPQLGALGAAWGCLATQCVFAFGCILKSMQYLHRSTSA